MFCHEYRIRKLPQRRALVEGTFNSSGPSDGAGTGHPAETPRDPRNGIHGVISNPLMPIALFDADVEAVGLEAPAPAARKQPRLP